MLKVLMDNFIYANKYNERRNFLMHCNTLKKIIESNNLVIVKDIEDSDYYLNERNSNKVVLIGILNEFIEFLKSKGHDVKSPYTRNPFIKFNRQIEILKYLHIPQDKNKILENFYISEKTAARDIAELKKGIPFLDWNIKIKPVTIRSKLSSRSEDKKYISSASPIGLVLNLSQVHSLTIGVLDSLDRESRVYMNHLDFSNTIMTQLSDYAKSIILDSNQGKHKLITDKKLTFQSEAEMFKEDNSSKLDFLYKRNYSTGNAYGAITYMKDFEEITKVLKIERYESNNGIFMDRKDIEYCINIDDIIHIDFIDSYI